MRFASSLQADVEQAQRVTRTLQQLPREVAAVLPYRSIEVLSLQPSQSLDALFEPGFVHALVTLGEHDAYARKEELLAFFA